MKVNVNFMKKIESEGLNLRATDIIITQSQNETFTFYNYVKADDEEIELLDLKESIIYANYDNLEQLIEDVKKGYIINFQDDYEIVLGIIKNDELMYALEQQRL